MRYPELPKSAGPLRWVATVHLRDSISTAIGATVPSVGVSTLDSRSPHLLRGFTDTSRTGKPGSTSTLPLRFAAEFELILDLMRTGEPTGLGRRSRSVNVPLDDPILITPSDEGRILEPQVEASALETALERLRRQ